MNEEEFLALESLLREQFGAIGAPELGDESVCAARRAVDDILRLPDTRTRARDCLFVSWGEDMADKLEREVVSRLQTALDEFKRGVITKDECVARFYQEASILEEDQWRIIESLRTQAPENERELARQVADQLEEELRKGSGNA